jgi:hypothetical protein
LVHDFGRHAFPVQLSRALDWRSHSVLHLFSFALYTPPILLGQLRWKPDLVPCIAPAFFCASFAWFTARLCVAKTWLHLQHFERKNTLWKT